MSADAPHNVAGPRAAPSLIPVFPLAGAILLPGGRLPLNIFEPRYLRMVDAALAGARVIGMTQPRELAEDDAAPPLYDVGSLGRIVSFAETGDGRYLITLGGVSRFRIIREIANGEPYRSVEADYAPFAHDRSPDETAALVDRETLFDAMRAYLVAEGVSADWEAAFEAPTDALVNSLAMGCPFAPNEKQALLEAGTIEERARCLVALMRMAGGEDSGETLQ
jgi:Lon protease-like protein